MDGVSQAVMLNVPEKGIITYVVTGTSFSSTSDISDNGARNKHKENANTQYKNQPAINAPKSYGIGNSPKAPNTTAINTNAMVAPIASIRVRTKMKSKTLI